MNTCRGIKDKAVGKPKAEMVKWPLSNEARGGMARVRRKRMVR
jgi:hypothetical protein